MSIYSSKSSMWSIPGGVPPEENSSFVGKWKNTFSDFITKISTWPRDNRALYRYLHLRYRIGKMKKRDSGVGTIFRENALRTPDKIAFLFEDEQWTFMQVEEYSNRVANTFRGVVKKGDCIALFMQNRVEYIATWLGFAKLGAIPALINTNLRSSSLLHCITIVDSKIVVLGAEVQKALEEISGELGDTKVYVSNISEKHPFSYEGGINLDALLKAPELSCLPPPEMAEVRFKDRMVYIYTSGTTGMPKAAVITHSRCFLAAFAAYYMIGLSCHSDVLYSPLPLYHLAAGLMASGQSIVNGVTVVLKSKFSVSSYWSDCVKYKATAAQYIGEICRYLLNSEPKPEEKQHQLRVMFGNGLRPQLWEDFQNRFNIPLISEFYGATEGNANIINMDGKIGAVGFVSVLLPSFYPCCLIKLDDETHKPLRDDNGLCIRCKPGEPGEFVGRIIRNDPVRDFHGYADKRATESKIVKDVWRKGDAAFLSGDILVMDAEGYLYFRDRRGDTFRWKGENVSTTEVEGVVSRLAALSAVVVFGVEVPGTEGRAGMATIADPEKTVSLSALLTALKSELPSYAIPLFVRILKGSPDITGTFKLKKTRLQAEGFDPSACGEDEMFILQKGEYVLVTQELYRMIVDGKIRV